MRSSPHSTRFVLRPSLVAWIIVAVALVVRFRYLLYIEHNVDHAYTVWQAMRTLDAGVFPLAGQGTSVLFANPPLTGYLYIPVVALTRSPLGVYLFLIALNTFGVWFSYRAVRALLGDWAGVFAAALMAVNPWMIEYSRTIWVQGLLPFFVSGVAWLLWPVLTGRAQKPERSLTLALIMTTALAHTYLLAYLIVAPVGALIVLFWRRLPKRALMIGASIFLVVAVLYGLGLLSNWDDVNESVSDFGASPARITTDAWDAAARLVTGAEYELARGTEAPTNDSALRHDVSQVAHGVVLGLLIVGIGRAIYAVFRRTDHRDTAVILLVWFFLPVVAMSYTGNPVHTFYQLMGIPAGYGLAAWGLLTVAEVPLPRMRTTVAYAAGIALLPFAALMLTNSARYYQETAATPSAHGFLAMPLESGLRLGQVIDDALPESGVVFVDAEAWIVNSFAGRVFPAVWDTRAPSFYTLPANGGLMIRLSTDAPPVVNESTERVSLSQRDEAFMWIDVLPPVQAITLSGETLDIPTAQGLTLHRYDLVALDDTTWEIVTHWRVDAPPDEAVEWILQPFIHVFDAEDTQVVNVSGEGLPGFRWSVGDLHVHRSTFTLPQDATGPFTIQVGQFDGGQNTRLTFLPPDAEPTTALLLPETLP